MRTAVKSLILFVLIAFAIGLVMIFAKTRVNPPISIKQINQYEKEIENSFTLFKAPMLTSINKSSNADKAFSKINSMVSIFFEENKIDDKYADKAKTKLFNTYLPLFYDNSMELFKNAVWEDSAHDHFLRVINCLKGVKYSNGNTVLKQSSIDSLSVISNTISNYRQAKVLCKSTQFTSLANSKEIVKKARYYQSDSYLKNCVDLVISLKSLPQKVEMSHYDYICQQVDRLNNYKKCKRDYYENTLIPLVDKVVTEYDKEANVTYGTKRDVSVLWEKAKRSYDKAVDWYDSNGN